MTRAFLCSEPDWAAEVLRKPSPYVAPYLSRKQGEALLRLLEAQPQKKWEPLRKALRKALAKNAGGAP